MRLQSQRLYPAPRTIPVADINAAHEFVLKHAASIKNSPMKLLVAGNPILPSVNTIKITENSGIT